MRNYYFLRKDENHFVFFVFIIVQNIYCYENEYNCCKLHVYAACECAK